jgi:hypothetical protein
MCLSFQLEKNAETVKNAHSKYNLKHGDNISCDNSTLHIHQKSDGSIIVIQSIPVSGTPSVFFPINQEFVKYLIPCGELTCQAAKLDAIINPSKYVTYEEQIFPIYRSLNIPDIKSLQIAPLKIIKNPDGGIIAILPVGEYIKRNITQEERASLGPKMLECIKQGLMSIGMTLKNVIGIDDDMTEFALLNFLFDAATPDCDIIIGIMPSGKTEGTFTFCFNIEEGINEIPILGLTHGDKKVLQDVENTFYVTGNKPKKLTFKADQPYEGETDKDFKKDVSFTIKSPDEFTSDYYINLEDFENEIDTEYEYDGKRGISSHGNYIWQENQKTFQEKYVDEYKDGISKFILNTVSDKRVIWSGLYLTELKEHVKVIPRNTTKAYIETY